MRWLLSRSNAELAETLEYIGDSFWPIGSQGYRVLREAAKRLRHPRARRLPLSAFLPPGQ